eukprot:1152346-Pelagomonas_calceolata.AAC.2
MLDTTSRASGKDPKISAEINSACTGSILELNLMQQMVLARAAYGYKTYRPEDLTAGVAPNL